MEEAEDLLVEEEEDLGWSLPAFGNPTSNEKENEIMKRRKKRGASFNFNLNQSLAWNNAFFTEQGVLNQQELSILSGSQHTFEEEFLSSIAEEGTHLLQNDTESSDSSSQHLEAKLFHTLPPRLPKRDPKKTSRELVKAVKSFSQAGGCPRPPAPASEKNLQSINSRNVLTKDVKLPTFAASKSPSDVSKVPKIAGLDAKRSSCYRGRPEGSHEKKDFPKGLSNTCKTSFGSSKTRYSGKDVASIATSGTKVIAAPLPTVDRSSSKIGVPLPQSAQHSGQRSTNAQTFVPKPSGLRPPSPSLRYFAQPQASTSLSVKSSGNTISCNLQDNLRSVHEPAWTAERMPGRGINASNCLTLPATATTMHRSCKFNYGNKIKVAGNLEAPPLANSETNIHDVGGADNMTEHQHFRGLTKSNIKPITCEVEKVERMENDVVQKSGARLVDNDIDGPKNNISSEETKTSDSSYSKFSGSRETNARRLEILQASSPVSCGGEKCGGSGSDYLSEDMKTKHVGDDIERRKLELHDDWLQVDNDDVGTLLIQEQDRVKKKTESESMDSACENKDKYESIPQLKQESRLKHNVNAAPFSDEWVAALQEAGEEILTMKTGAVQNSPPDKPCPELGPWSPVKRKNASEIGPFDCTKYTSTQTNQL